MAPLLALAAMACEPGADGSVQAVKRAAVGPLAAPTNLVVNYYNGEHLSLSWTDNSTAEQRFELWRHDHASGAWMPAEGVGANQTTGHDYEAVPGETYTYYVYAVNSVGTYSDSSNGVWVRLISPEAPSNAEARVIGHGQVRISWWDNSPDEKAFHVYRATSPTSFDLHSPYCTVGPDVASCDIFDPAPAGTTVYYQVRAINHYWYSEPSNTVSAFYGVPPAPGGLAGFPDGGYQATLYWNDNSSTEDGFQIDRIVGTSTVEATFYADRDATSFTDYWLSPGSTYKYRVRAYNGYGNSNWSGTITLKTEGPPSTPGNLTATAMGNFVRVRWNASSSGNVDWYRVEKSFSGTGDWWSFCYPADTQCDDWDVSPSTWYDYRVLAENQWGSSGYSNVASVQTNGPPDDPSHFVATPASSTSVTLTWSDNSSNETGFEIERWENGVLTRVWTVDGGVTSTTDTGLVPGGTYGYWMRAVNAVGSSGWQGPAWATTPTPPEAPSNLRATIVSGTQIDLSWWDNSWDETRFRLERSTDGTNFSSIATPAAGATVYQNTGLTRGTTYHYRIRAENGGGSSAYSNVVTVLLNAPTAPSAVTVALWDVGEVMVTWIDNAGSETGFRVERALGGSTSFAAVAGCSLGPDETWCIDRGTFSLGASYQYRVVAHNPAGTAASGAVALTYAMPPTPSSLSATIVSPTRIDLAWTNTADNATGLGIDVWINGNWVRTASAGPRATTYSDTGLTAGNTYEYRVWAWNALGTTDSSNPATVLLAAPSAPGALAAKVITASRIDLTWADTASNETGFRVERAASGSTTWAAVAGCATLAANAQSCSDTSGLASGSTYQYRVSAYNAVGSALSTAVTATIATPAAPSNLTGQVTSATQVTLSWRDNATNEVGFRIERSTDNGATFSQVGTTGADVTSHADGGRTANSTVVYRVRAHNGVGNSGYSGTLTIRVGAPPAPSGLTGRMGSNASVDLTWTDASNNETGFVVARASDGTTFGDLPALPAGTTSFKDTGLTAGPTYSYRVRAINGAGASGNSNTVAVTLAPPGAPSNLVGQVASTTQINLSWTDNAGNEDGFQVERSTDGVAFTLIGGPAANTTTFNNTGLTNGGTYWYRVLAWNGLGNSAYSNLVQVTIARPAAPSGLLASAASTTSIRLEWTDNASNETGFKIERSTTSATAGFTQVGTAGVNAVSFTNTGLTTSTNYWFRVRATNGTGDSPYSNAAATRTAVPAAPSTLAAVLVSAGRIDLTWRDNATSESGFQVERATNGTTFTLLGTTAANVISLTDTALVLGTNYTYRVRATAGAGNSAYSNTAAVVYAVPATPTGLAATIVSPTRVDLSWTDAASNESSYAVERSRDGTAFTPLTTTLGAGATTYTDGTVTGEGPYHYRVIASNLLGASPPSTVLTVALQRPAAPSKLEGTVVSATQINLKWTDNADNETGFRIERGTSGSNLVEVGTSGRNVATFNNTGLTANTTYFFRVRAHNGVGLSYYSELISVRTAAPPVPTGLVATVLSATSVRLEWQDVSNNETRFIVERSTQQTSGFGQAGTSPANVPTFTNTGLTSGGTFYFRVKADNGAGASGPSNTVKVTLRAPSAPSALVVTAMSGSAIRLNWNDNSDSEAGFRVQRSPDGTTGWADLNVVGQGVRTLVNNNLAPGTPYHYRVRAENALGNSSWLGPASATTLGRCVNEPDGLSCADANACNGIEVCRANACRAENVPQVDDGNACTVDSCTPATGALTHTVDTTLAGCDALQPRLECVAEGQGSGGLFAVFGYVNSLSTNVSKPLGAENQFTPGVRGRGQPTIFQVGTRQNVFAVPLPAGETLTWTLGRGTAVAGSTSPRCALVDCNTLTGSVLALGHDKCVPLGSGELPLPADTILAGSSGVGPPADLGLGPPTPARVGGATDVTKDGAFSYDIALRVPPGRAQLQPALSIGYSSRNGDGDLGFGWALHGLSEISRCKQTLAQNGALSAVLFHDVDALCLDGNQLVVVGEDAMARTQYRTESDQFALITLLASDAMGPLSFEVRSRDGLIHTYGGSSDSRLEGPQARPSAPNTESRVFQTTTSHPRTVRLSWALNETRDRHDNTITYRYKRTAGTRDNGYAVDRLLDSILYTGRKDLSYSAGHGLQFNYEDRPDKRFSYVSGLRLSSNQRLRSIEMTELNPQVTDSTLPAVAGRVRTYKLSYRSDLTVSRRSLLESIVECDAQDLCTPPTRFTYTPGRDTFVGTRTSITDMVHHLQISDIVVGDVNGDGLDDIVYRLPTSANPSLLDRDAARWYVRLNQGDGRFGERVLTPLPSGHQSRTAGSALRAFDGRFEIGRMADLDMDGKADFIAQDGGNSYDGIQRWVYHYSNGSGYDPVAIEQTEIDTSTPSPDLDAMPLWVADLNGDGYPEVLRPLWTQFHADKCRFSPAVGLGDCFKALGVRINDRGRLQPWKMLTEIQRFPDAVNEQQFPYKHDRGTAAWFITDTDGDGAAEFLTTETKEQQPDLGTLLANFLLRGLSLDPSGEVRGKRTTLPWHLRAGKEKMPLRHHFMDVNGDGLSDVVIAVEETENHSLDEDFDPPRTSRPYVVINTGNGFGNVNEALLEPGPDPLPGLQKRWQLTQEALGGNAQVIDIDQDGRQDLLSLDDADGGRTQPILYRAQGDPAQILRDHPGLSTMADVDPHGVHFRPEVLASVPLSSKKHHQGILPFWRTASTRLARTGDFDGDGLEDIIQFQADGTVWVYSRNSGPGARDSRADLLSRVEDGMGGTAAITYRGITEGEAIYTRGEDCAHPQYCVTRGVVVVSELKLNEGKDGDRQFWFFYKDGRMDLLGRGWLGFRSKTVVDLDTGVEFMETYDNSTRVGTAYPLAGLVVGQRRKGLVEASSSLGREDTRTITYTQLTPAAGTHAAVPHVTTDTETEGGDAFRRVTVTHDQYDQFGNAWRTVMASGDGNTLERRLSFENDSSRWMIGLLKHSVETSTARNGESETRTSHLFRDPNTGAVIVEELEPQVPGQPRRPEYHMTVYGRDTLGNVTSVTEYDASGAQREVVITYDWAHKTHPVETRTSMGLVHRYAFASAFGELAVTEDPNGHVMRRQFDGFGRTRRQERPDQSDLDVFYSATPDGVGMQVATVRAGGEAMVITTDHLSREVRRKERGSDGRLNVVERDYEKVGRNVYRQSRPFKDGETARQWNRLELDNLGRMRFERAADGSHREVRYSGLDTTIFDQKRNKSVQLEDQSRLITTTIEEAAGGREIATTYDYGPFGVLRKIIDARRNETVMAYDRAGRRTEIVDPDSGRSTFGYNGFGDLTSETDANGVTTSYTYDGDGRPRTISNVGGLDTFEWDSAQHGLGRPAGHSRVNHGVADGFVSSTYRFNALSQLTGVDRRIKGAEYAVGFTYDGYGRRLDTTYPAVAGRPPLVVRNGYNPHTGALMQVGPAANPAIVYWRADAWDAHERITGETYGNGVTRTTGYDPLRDVGQRRIDSRSRTGAILQAFAYGYDPNGNLESRNDELNKVNETFGYDALDRLERWHYGAAGGGQHVVRYHWDDLGNLIKRAVEGGGGADNTFTYFDRAVNAGPHAVRSSTLLGSYTYDRKGNQITAPGRTVDYTPFNLPKVITTSDGQATEFGYDSQHRRAWKRHNSGRETVYVGDLYQRRHEATAVIHTFFVRNAAGPVAQLETEVSGTAVVDRTFYLHPEHLNSTELVTTGTGEVDRRFKLDPFGLRIDPTDPNREEATSLPSVRRGFAGHEHDDEFQLVNMGGRLYDPRTTRFLTPDSEISHALYGSSLNRYSYALNNPLRFDDPTGHSVDDGIFRHLRPPNPLPPMMRRGPQPQSAPQKAAPAATPAPQKAAPAPTMSPAKADDQQARQTQVNTPTAPTAAKTAPGCPPAEPARFERAFQGPLPLVPGLNTNPPLAPPNVSSPPSAQVPRVPGPEVLPTMGRIVARFLPFLLGVGLGIEAGQDFAEWREKRRKPLPVFRISYARTPFIAENVEKAILVEGKPAILNYAGPGAGESHRDEALEYLPRRVGKDGQQTRLSWDEYPFASTMQGGKGAVAGIVPLSENHRQGGDLSAFYARHNMKAGDPFLVIVTE